MESPTYQRGLKYLRLIEATEHPSIIESLKDIAPDLADLAIEFAYGAIYSRPGLDLKERQIATVAALAALGNARPQLKFHIRGVLNVGASAEEIIELLTHIAVYAGFPASLNGIFAAQEVFREKEVVPVVRPAAAGNEDRFEVGWEMLERIDGEAGNRVIAALSDIAPDLGRFVVEFGFGDVYTRPGLNLLLREIATVAALVAMGTATPQLKVHIHGLLNVGGTREKLVETVLHVAAYAGFPAAINGMLAAQEVLRDRAASGHAGLAQG